jgi:hypothetical protein
MHLQGCPPPWHHHKWMHHMLYHLRGWCTKSWHFRALSMAPLPVPSPIMAAPAVPFPAQVHQPPVEDQSLPQGVVGQQLFACFKEEHHQEEEQTWYHTRSRTKHHAANHTQHTPPPRIFHPLTFTSSVVTDNPRAEQPLFIPMVNTMTNPLSGAINEYQQLIADADTCHVWDRSTANKFGCLAPGVGIQCTSLPIVHSHNGRLSLMAALWGMSTPTNQKCTTSASLLAVTSSTTLGMCTQGQLISLHPNAFGTALSPLMGPGTCKYMSRTSIWAPLWTFLSI